MERNSSMQFTRLPAGGSAPSAGPTPGSWPRTPRPPTCPAPRRLPSHPGPPRPSSRTPARSISWNSSRTCSTAQANIRRSYSWSHKSVGSPSGAGCSFKLSLLVGIAAAAHAPLRTGQKVVQLVPRHRVEPAAERAARRVVVQAPRGAGHRPQHVLHQVGGVGVLQGRACGRSRRSGRRTPARTGARPPCRAGRGCGPAGWRGWPATLPLRRVPRGRGPGRCATL